MVSLPAEDDGIINGDGYNRAEEIMANIGYSGTPLAKKLELKEGMTLLTVNAPKEYRAWLGDLPDGIKFETRTKPPIEAAHIFTTERALVHKSKSRHNPSIGSYRLGNFVALRHTQMGHSIESSATDQGLRRLGFQ